MIQMHPSEDTYLDKMYFQTKQYDKLRFFSHLQWMETRCLGDI